MATKPVVAKNRKVPIARKEKIKDTPAIPAMKQTSIASFVKKADKSMHIGPPWSSGSLFCLALCSGRANLSVYLIQFLDNSNYSIPAQYDEIDSDDSLEMSLKDKLEEFANAKLSKKEELFHPRSPVAKDKSEKQLCSVYGS